MAGGDSQARRLSAEARARELRVAVPGRGVFAIQPERLADFWASVGISRIVLDAHEDGGPQAHWYFGGVYVCGVDGDLGVLRCAIRTWRRAGQLHTFCGKRVRWSGCMDVELRETVPSAAAA